MKDEPAFPELDSSYEETNGDFAHITKGGLTKGELFAAMAMMGGLAAGLPERRYSAEDFKSVAKGWISAADALLVELNRGKEAI